MLDHIGFEVSDFEKSKAFYIKALAPLGYTLLFDLKIEDELFAGFGIDNKPYFWLYNGKQVSPGIHVAFAASSHAMVDTFYAAAIAAGGKDNGKPGIRAEYHPNYYGAFVLDPDGHNIEAVCHEAL